MIMSTQSGHALLSPAPDGAEATHAPARLAWLRAIGHFREKLRRSRQLQDLVELDDRLLADIGITRERALSAAKKAYWI